ncbi:hypothetical protein BC832DRAFT_545181 [Gaertneriomyces semiglobifer]|nr:hypothetical protein BC832DRAFT_545181 [Gaertneriomyces semiglobifer]
MGALDNFIKRHIGFIPKSFEDLAWYFRVRPDLPPIMVAAKEYREISPGSQPAYNPEREQKIAKNYYYTRDTRRAYPQTVVYESQEVTKLLPASASEPMYNESKLPPMINKRYKWTEAMFHLRPDEVNPDLSIRGRK